MAVIVPDDTTYIDPGHRNMSCKMAKINRLEGKYPKSKGEHLQIFSTIDNDFDLI